MLSEIIFASHNAGKIKEIKELLKPFNINVKSALDMDLPDVEETGETFWENSLLKSQTIARLKSGFCKRNGKIAVGNGAKSKQKS